MTAGEANNPLHKEFAAMNATLSGCSRETVLEPAAKRELKPTRPIYHWGQLIELNGDATALRIGDKEIPLLNGHIRMDYRKFGPQEVVVGRRNGVVVLEFPMIGAKS